MDYANVYGAGTSEEIVGRAIKQLTTREHVVLATKLYWPMHAGPGGGARKLEAVEALAKVAGDAGLSLIELAIAFVIRHHGFPRPTSCSTTPCSTASTRSSSPA